MIYDSRAPVFVAIDTPDLQQAQTLAAQVSPFVAGIKLGLTFFCAQGPSGVQTIRDAHPDMALFLDLKLHDIPETVVGAFNAVAPLRPAFFTVHTSGGPDMLTQLVAARDALDSPTRLLGVTVLTSLDDSALEAVGQHTPAPDQVRRLARLAKDKGIDGIVCSPQEVGQLRRLYGSELTLVTPGIRMAFDDVHDQKRIAAPDQALRDGADWLVVGRPVTHAPDPAVAAQKLAQVCAAARQLSACTP